MNQFSDQVSQGKYRFRSTFRKIRLYAYNLTSIEFALLHAAGIQGILLDLDNTIVSEDDQYMSPGVEEWIAQAKASGFKLFLLSNGKRRYRVRYWSHYFQLAAISPARKPFPMSFRKALKVMQLRPQQAVVIGDSWHTDILGAWLVGCSSIQVATLPHPLRWWEKLFGKHIQVPYPNPIELQTIRQYYDHCNQDW